MTSTLTDSFGRKITYLRMSLTDRCDLRCFYCMAEKMVFLPKKQLLSLEELGHIADAFIERGVRKIRLSGGEPLVRKGFLTLVEHLSAHLNAGRIDEIALTTNATQLKRFAWPLKDLGVQRINVSLDSLNPSTFKHITRGGDITQVMAGIDAALSAGLHIKINTVALKNDNAHEIPTMIQWAHGRGMDISLIEIMPMGDTGKDRFTQYIPLLDIRSRLEQNWTLTDTPETTGGPSRYVRIAQTGGRLGFISPLSQNFCAGCNRVRITCTGKLFMCLGKDNHVDLRAALRDGVKGDGVKGDGVKGDGAKDGCSTHKLDAALDTAMIAKPEKHDFIIDKAGTAPAVTRHMSVTGG